MKKKRSVIPLWLIIVDVLWLLSKVIISLLSRIPLIGKLFLVISKIALGKWAIILLILLNLIIIIARLRRNKKLKLGAEMVAEGVAEGVAAAQNAGTTNSSNQGMGNMNIFGG